MDWRPARTSGGVMLGGRLHRKGGLPLQPLGSTRGPVMLGRRGGHCLGVAYAAHHTTMLDVGCCGGQSPHRLALGKRCNCSVHRGRAGRYNRGCWLCRRRRRKRVTFNNRANSRTSPNYSWTSQNGSSRPDAWTRDFVAEISQPISVRLWRENVE